MWSRLLIDQLEEKELDFIDSEDDEEEDRDEEKKSTATRRLKFIRDEFVEFVRRCDLKHSFCIHWTQLTDKLCFIQVPTYHNNGDVKHYTRIPLQETLKSESNLMNHERYHDSSSGWICSHSSAALITYEPRIMINSDNYLNYYLVTSTDAKELHPWYCPKGAAYFNWCFDVQNRLRTNAGYEPDEERSCMHHFTSTRILSVCLLCLRFRYT